jgi:hypothetical protein
MPAMTPEPPGSKPVPAPDGTTHFVQPKIVGYRQLSEADAALINTVKDLANEVGRLVDGMLLNGKLDTRWVATAKTDLQKGFMSLVRSIAQPDSF